MRLKNYQSEFLASFFESEAKPNHLLIAPTGSGKTIMVAKIIETLFSKNAERILIITNRREMVNQYKMIIEKYKPDAVQMILSTRTKREYEAIKKIDKDLLPNIIISTWESALSENSQQILFSNYWDLISIDLPIISITSQKVTLVEMLTRHANSKHLLFISVPMSGEYIKKIIGEKIDTFTITNWTSEMLFSEFGGKPNFILKMLNYKRTEQEIEFTHRYLKLSKKLPGNDFGHILRQDLVSSSLFAAEDSLRRYRNSLLHNSEGNFSEEESEINHDASDGQSLINVNNDQIKGEYDSENRPDLESLLINSFSSLETIEVDSKFESLQSYLEENKKQKFSIWIYSSFMTTIKYLYTSLKEKFLNVSYLHGGMTHTSVSEVISRFNSDGGILISSDNKLKGYLLKFNKIIFYDIPMNERQIYVILSRAETSKNEKSEKPVEIVLLKDLNETLRFEEENIQSIKHSLRSILSNEE